ncbi:hypothetical protein GCM10022226_62050 [Sphaerisporangium flaviroseum]|uniref:Uncharacterized protein n=1 Tax=Sphaerisporangium flaviroseum TaxID=509199 RepID=A0ABP7J2M7_9ACTN
MLDALPHQLAPFAGFQYHLPPSGKARYNWHMISAEQPLPTSGELADAVAIVASDGIFARPIRITGAGDTEAFIVSAELLEILQRALDHSATGEPEPSPQELVDSLGLELAADGTIGVSRG